MSEDRELDKNHVILRQNSKFGISVDVIKSKYIADGKTVREIAEECRIDVEKIQEIVDDNKLPELRKAYIIQGIQKIQNIQLHQSHKLMNLENNFKKLRIIQLEKELEDYLAYYARHGHFYKLHPVTNDILRNTDGIPMQVRLPNVYRELIQLKESVTLSSGVHALLNKLDDLINTKEETIIDDDEDTINVDYTEIFGDK